MAFALSATPTNMIRSPRPTTSSLFAVPQQHRRRRPARRVPNLPPLQRRTAGGSGTPRGTGRGPRTFASARAGRGWPRWVADWEESIDLEPSWTPLESIGSAGGRSPDVRRGRRANRRPAHRIRRAGVAADRTGQRLRGPGDRGGGWGSRPAGAIPPADAAGGGSHPVARRGPGVRRNGQRLPRGLGIPEQRRVRRHARPGHRRRHRRAICRELDPRTRHRPNRRGGNWTSSTIDSWIASSSGIGPTRGSPIGSRGSGSNCSMSADRSSGSGSSTRSPDPA